MLWYYQQYSKQASIQIRPSICSTYINANFILINNQTFSISVIELACGEYGEDKITYLRDKSENGGSLNWFDNPKEIQSMDELRKNCPMSDLRELERDKNVEETSQGNQRIVLIKRGFLKAKRDTVSSISAK